MAAQGAVLSRPRGAGERRGPARGPRGGIPAAARRGLGLRRVRLAAVLRRFPALLHSIVAQHARHAQAVVGENASAAFRLRRAVALEIAPALDRLLVAPERERQELGLVGEA